MRFTFVNGWIALKCWAEFHCAQTMNHNNVGDPLIFPLALPSRRKEGAAFWVWKLFFQLQCIHVHESECGSSVDNVLAFYHSEYLNNTLVAQVFEWCGGAKETGHVNHTSHFTFCLVPSTPFLFTFIHNISVSYDINSATPVPKLFWLSSTVIPFPFPSMYFVFRANYVSMPRWKLKLIQY